MQDEQQLPQRPLLFPIYSLFEQYYIENNIQKPVLTQQALEYLEKLVDSLFTLLLNSSQAYRDPDKQITIFQQNIAKNRLDKFLQSKIYLNTSYFINHLSMSNDLDNQTAQSQYLFLNSNKIPSFLEIQNATQQNHKHNSDIELADLLFEQIDFKAELQIEVNVWDITGVALTAANALYYGQEGYGDQLQKIIRRSAEYGK
ncbi:hypothetical protein SS50377_23380 [Spironucleus salmonicida]|uniref:Uncharacterized protein n=1 Tax=Spironucleus salmonicida TaxID=348837 RepID=V6LRH1_9EUKA|nr:hypothetical protein SS50377_23380 [Spironucleus salmonicida]|eukprot:EST47252.1 Hypothetical protein SS50377_12762 [Spironucleus salmonicida]